MQQVAQCQEDRSAADGQHHRRLTTGPEVADHVDVLTLRLLVDRRRHRCPAGLHAHLDQRGRLGEHEVRLVEERQEVERLVDHRVAVTTDVEDLDDLELAGLERALLLEEHRRLRLHLPELRR